jgi:anti-anti-sigma regulatory factor
VAFCDVAALAMLIGVQRRLRWRGITVRLAPRPQAAKLLRITGLDRSFMICATLDDAFPAHVGKDICTGPGGSLA